jgi:L-ribulose-5-phosphate 3-epimerase
MTTQLTPAWGGSTFSFMWSSTALSAMREMRALGLRTFDIIMVPGHCWHDEMAATERANLASTLRAEDMTIDSLNLPALDQNLASCIPEVRDYAVQLYTAALRLSADLGGKAVVAVPGRVSALFPPPDASSEGWLADGLERLLRVAERLDQRIFIESHPQTPIPTVDKIEAFLEQLQHPRLLVAYDVSNAEYVSENQVTAIRRLAPRLGQVHLSDGTPTRWRHDRIGTGTVDFPAILATRAEIGFSGTSVLEIISSRPIQDISASLDALRAV